MAEVSTFVADVRKYAQLVEPMMPPAPAFAPTAETATSVQVERGIVLPRCMRGDGTSPQEDVVGRLAELSSHSDLSRFAVIDAAGHHRPVYRPLLVYAWLQAFRIVYETLPREQFGRWEEGLRPWCDLLEAELGDVTWRDGPMPAARGPSAAEAAWIALALHAAGKVYVRDAWTDLAGDTFGRIVRAQQPNGTFLSLEASDNPETAWYHELVILHAAASYAVQAEDRTVAAAVRRATTFHQDETQPDHATTQPWGLFAFVWNPQTRPVADQLLHALTVQHPAGVTGVPLMLLADALYCLRLFL